MQKTKKLLRYIFHIISRCIYWIVPKEFRSAPQETTIDSLIKNSTTSANYEYFKEVFKTSILYSDIESIRKYAIQSSISNDKGKELFYLEFGVFKGNSTNFFSKYVKKMYAFDSFEGLREDWLGSWGKGRGYFNLNKKIPKLNSNIEPIVGFVQDTLDDFLKKHNPQINFAHFDLDTYPSTKYALERLKPFFNEGAIIIFDEFYNYPGWESGEYKALKEVFKDEEYTFKAFNTFDQQVVIQLK